MKLDQLLQRRRGRVPRPSKLTFIAVSILVCLYLLYGLAKTRRRATTYGVGPEHPVEALHKAASTRFTDMMARQSGSPEEAAKEYVRRYARQPPPGFEDWVSYTIARDSPVIDDFDLIMEGLGPFWKLAATEIKDLMKRATDGQVDHIWMCSFVSGKFTRKECEVYTDLFNDWMGDTKATLPDFEIPINFLDEPSVLPDELRDESRGPLNALRWSEKAHTSIRQEVAAACKIRGPPSRSHSHRYFDHVRTHGIPFVLYPEAEKDLCANPELGDGHGLILSPVSMWQMHYPIPLFSPAAPRPFLDILFPSSWYDLTGYFYEEDKDTVWSSKRNVLYWAGSSTGSYGHDDASWRHSHRQRLAALVMGADPTRSFAYLDSSLGSLRSYHSRALNASHYDVHITTIRHCDDPICDIEKTYFLPPSDDDRPADDAAYDARFVFDIDGNSYSGRFYRLLESHGCVLKSTMFREWHDERLIPWLHYVPVSQGLEELPELMRFLVETKAGQEVGRRVAEAGRNWTRRALRPVDRGVYLYRLFLETTWLLNPTRVPG